MGPLELLGLDEDMRPEGPHDGIGALMTRHSGELSLSLPWEDTAQRQPSAEKEVSSH